jgi:predicted dehydrogenase
MTMKKRNIGIIGAGMIAEAHIEAIQKTGRGVVSWIADLSPERLKIVKDKFSIKNTTDDYHEILKDDKVDAVIVCTPPKYHKGIFMETVQAGKHTLMEKPLGMNLKEIDEMIALSTEHPNVIVGDCSARHSRLQPRFRKVKEIIDSGKLGEIYYVHHNCVWRHARGGIEYHPEAKWFLNKAIAGGGPLFDWGVYDLSFHLGVLGDKVGLENVDSVMLKNGLDDVDPGTDIFDVEEHFVANLQLTDGIRFYWERSNNANMEADNETRIYGTRGGIKLGYCSWDDPVIEFFDVDDHAKGEARKESFTEGLADHDDSLALMEHFMDVLEGKAKMAMPLELARKHLEIIFKCYDKA